MQRLLMARHIQQWWTASDPSLLLKAEHRLLASLVEHPFRKPVVSRRDRIGRLNLVEFQAISHVATGRSSSLPTVVLSHGFGSGLSFFYRNIDRLLTSGKVSRVVLVDWPGMGGSARPPCWQSPIRSLFSNSQSSSSASRFSLCNSKFTTSQSIDFFLDPFDELLNNENIFDKGEPLWLVGHSLGGYLAAKYAMRIHEQQSTSEATTVPNLTKLILASPVGFQPPPSPHDRIASSNLPPAFRLVDALWSSNLTPQALVRLMGSSRGKNAVKRALQGRIPHLSEKSLDLLAEYLYHITVAPASGEYALNSLLEPAASKDGAGVYAREPLGGGLMADALSKNPSSLENIKVLFGDKDWMSFNEPAAKNEMKMINSQCGIQSDVHTVPNTGHHLYIDNAPDFVRHILED